MTSGIDVSSNNHTSGQPWNYPDSDGIDFVYVKGTQGDNYLNPYMLGDVQGFKAAGKQVGLYHFYDPAVPAAAQADYFKRNALDAITTDLMPMVDIEPLNGAVATAEERDEFCDAIGNCGQYMDRTRYADLSDGTSKALWLAWPGWTDEPLPPTCKIVQSGTRIFAGGGNIAVDVDTAIPLPQPPTPIPEGTEMASPLYVSSKQPTGFADQVVYIAGEFTDQDGVVHPAGNIIQAMWNNGTWTVYDQTANKILTAWPVACTT